MDIPVLPVDDCILSEGDLARLLMGDDRGSGVLPIFASRVLIFNKQPLRIDSSETWGLFYERLRDPSEVLWALSLSMKLGRAGFRWGSGLLVTLDIEMWNSFFSAPNGAVSMPGEGDVLIGDHSVTLIDVHGDDHRLRFAHIFSNDWGDEGRGSLPLDYLMEHTRYAHATRAYGGPSQSASWADHEEHLNDFAKAYGDLRREAKWELRHADDDVIWTGRVLTGTGSLDPWIQAGLLVRGISEQPLLVGWFSGRRVDDVVLEVEEFFVWPPYRRRGLGTALAGRSLLFACETGLRAVRWLELDADAIVKARLQYAYPSWTASWSWGPAYPELGWGVARITKDIPIMELLTDLGSRHAPGGVQLAGNASARMVFVTDHVANPTRSLLLARDVHPHRSLPEVSVEGATFYRATR